MVCLFWAVPLIGNGEGDSVNEGDDDNVMMMVMMVVMITVMMMLG